MTIRHILINSNVLWEDGKFIHTRCFTRDITERKRTEEEREQLLAREHEAQVGPRRLSAPAMSSSRSLPTSSRRR